jgi:hypothetical protein
MSGQENVVFEVAADEVAATVGARSKSAHWPATPATEPLPPLASKRTAHSESPAALASSAFPRMIAVTVAATPGYLMTCLAARPVRSAY